MPEYNALPLQLKAGEAVSVTVRTSGALELVNLDRRGRFWARFDGEAAEPLQPNNFVVMASRRYPTNKGLVTVSLIAEQDVWVTVEGAVFG